MLFFYYYIGNLKFQKINQLIKANINLISNNLTITLEKIIADCPKEVILDNKINDFEYEDNIDFSKYSSNIKAIAIYIPTFYYENEKYKRYESLNEINLEWKKVKEAKPLFNNHYQPRKPVKQEKYLGYYNLNNIKVIEKQINLAKKHGIYGFGIYYYWINGEILFDTPLKLFFFNKINFHFFLIWKNDYVNNKKHYIFKKNNMALIEDIEKYLLDSRYIKINEKLVIGIYEPLKIKNLEYIIYKWRKKAKEKGIGDLFILANLNTYIYNDFQKFGNVFK